jgi:hypothetical protein
MRSANVCAAAAPAGRGNKRRRNEVSFGMTPAGRLTMSTISSTGKPMIGRARFSAQLPISRDDAGQDAADHRVLYVLGFGLACAIIANALVFIYFAVIYALG